MSSTANWKAPSRAPALAVPDPIPAEIYCHSLTDPSILSPELRETGAQTLTVFALHTPDRMLTAQTNDTLRHELGPPRCPPLIPSSPNPSRLS